MADETTEVPGEAVEALQHYFDTQHEFLSWLGLEVKTLEYGRAVLGIPYASRLTNTLPEWTEGDADARRPVNGGVASTLIDVSGGIALRPFLDDPVNDDLATVNLNVNYLQQALGDLEATAEVVRAGNTVGVARIGVESKTPHGERDLVAVGQGAYRLFSG